MFTNFNSKFCLPPGFEPGPSCTVIGNSATRSSLRHYVYAVNLIDDKPAVDNQMDNMLIMWLWRNADGRGAVAEWTSVVVYKCSQPLHHQLRHFSIHDCVHRSQPLPVRLLARSVRHSVYSPPHYRGCHFDVGGRRCTRPTEPSWLVVTRVWYQDSEVSVRPHHSLPLHHPLRRRRHAAAFRRHYNLLLPHLLPHSTCQTAHSQSTVPGKAQNTQNLQILYIVELHTPVDLDYLALIFPNLVKISQQETRVLSQALNRAMPHSRSQLEEGVNRKEIIFYLAVKL